MTPRRISTVVTGVVVVLAAMMIYHLFASAAYRSAIILKKASIWYTARGYIYALRLPNGEELTIGPNVKAYYADRRCVTGIVTGPEGLPDFFHGIGAEYPSWNAQNGYFVIDLHTMKMTTGLDEPHWLAHLRRYGIDTRPTLTNSPFPDK